MGVPRTKRTAKPEKRLYSALSRYRQGDTSVQVERDGDIVRLVHNASSFTIPAATFDSFMSSSADVHINIHIN